VGRGAGSRSSTVLIALALAALLLTALLLAALTGLLRLLVIALAALLAALLPALLILLIGIVHVTLLANTFPHRQVEPAPVGSSETKII
jgi:hypothetical protein